MTYWQLTSEFVCLYSDQHGGVPDCGPQVSDVRPRVRGQGRVPRAHGVPRAQEALQVHRVQLQLRVAAQTRPAHAQGNRRLDAAVDGKFSHEHLNVLKQENIALTGAKESIGVRSSISKQSCICLGCSVWSTPTNLGVCSPECCPKQIAGLDLHLRTPVVLDKPEKKQTFRKDCNKTVCANRFTVFWLVRFLFDVSQSGALITNQGTLDVLTGMALLKSVCSFGASSAISCVCPFQHDRSRYTCDICEATFKWKGNLTLHMKLHSGEGLHECRTCGELALQESVLCDDSYE